MPDQLVEALLSSGNSFAAVFAWVAWRFAKRVDCFLDAWKQAREEDKETAERAREDSADARQAVRDLTAAIVREAKAIERRVEPVAEGG
ncbi:MAG: hypothetical protein OEY28_00120 [Nitrospira sp.]|nr:hypothetical protein [Nitrospira sp.]